MQPGARFSEARARAVVENRAPDLRLVAFQDCQDCISYALAVVKAGSNR